MGVLEASWRRLGAAWGRIGTSWGRLGRVLGASWPQCYLGTLRRAKIAENAEPRAPNIKPPASPQVRWAAIPLQTSPFLRSYPAEPTSIQRPARDQDRKGASRQHIFNLFWAPVDLPNRCALKFQPSLFFMIFGGTGCKFRFLDFSIFLKNQYLAYKRILGGLNQAFDPLEL